MRTELLGPMTSGRGDLMEHLLSMALRKAFFKEVDDGSPPPTMAFEIMHKLCSGSHLSGIREGEERQNEDGPMPATLGSVCQTKEAARTEVFARQG